MSLKDFLENLEIGEAKTKLSKDDIKERNRLLQELAKAIVEAPEKKKEIEKKEKMEK